MSIVDGNKIRCLEDFELASYFGNDRILINSSNRLPRKGTEVKGYKIVAIVKRSDFENCKDLRDLGPLVYGLMTITIDEKADRVANIYSDKCRCSRCTVKAIHSIHRELTDKRFTGKGIAINDDSVDGSVNLQVNIDQIDYANFVAISPMYNYISTVNGILYEKDSTIESDYDDSMFRMCTKGIHFFTSINAALEFAVKNKLYTEYNI